MSKLADLLRRTTGAQPAPLGFASGSRKAPPTLLLVALAADRWSKAAAEATEAGADAVLLTGSPDGKELTKAVSAAGDSPVGVALDDASADQLASLKDAKIDFVMLQTKAPASALLDKEFGRVLGVSADLSDVQLRTLEALSINAVSVDQMDAPLTIERQLELRRVSGLARKPLLLPITADAGEEELLSLREAGVALLAVDMGAGGVDALRRLRKVVDKLPQRRHERDESSVTLPAHAGAHGHDEEAEEDDDD